MFHFPSGCRFEHERDFVFLNRPDSRAAICFMQSVLHIRNCVSSCCRFLSVDPDYQLALDEEALADLQSAAEAPAAHRQRISCAPRWSCAGAGDQEPPTANLMAPVVVNLQATHRVCR